MAPVSKAANLPRTSEDVLTPSVSADFEETYSSQSCKGGLSAGRWREIPAGISHDLATSYGNGLTAGQIITVSR